MRQSLVTIIERFRVISDLTNEEDDHIMNLRTDSSDSLKIITSESVELLMEPRPAGNALQAFLNALPDEYVFAIEVLMYAGRDDADVNIIDFANTLPSFNKEECILAISEKEQRMKYMDEYFKKHSENEINNIPVQMLSLIRKKGS